MSKIHRNDPCPCGSGKKYKNCCGKKQLNTSKNIFSTGIKLKEAFEYHKEGKLEKARSLYQEILKAQPENPEALHLMGLLSFQCGRFDEAQEYIKKAIKINPYNAFYYANLGKIYLQLNRKEDALECYEKALELKRDFVEVSYILGVLYEEKGEFSKSLEYYNHVINLNGGTPEVYNNMANILKKEGKHQQAIEYYKKALEKDPNYVYALYNLGNTYLHTSAPEKAIEYYKKTIEINPSFIEAYYNLGNALEMAGNSQEAISYYEKGLKIQPDDPSLWNNMGNAFLSIGEIEKASECYNKAYKLTNNTKYLCNLAMSKVNQGKIEDAISLYEKALNTSLIDSKSYSSYLMSLLYYKEDEDKILRLHKKWEELYGNKDNFLASRSTSNRSFFNKKIRIGYVSGDFRLHSIYYFLNPLLKYYSRESFEVYCYSNIETSDHFTESLKEQVNRWINIRGLSDENAASLILEDNIDILVDLSGHTKDNRLRIFTYHPAKLQVTYLGYPFSTGLKSIEYKITDEIVDPPSNQKFYTEKLEYISPPFLCYTPPNVDISPKYTPEDSYIDLCCFNNIAKINKEVINVWIEILKKVKNSRLILKNIAFNDIRTMEYWKQLFESQGIEKERLILYKKLELEKHLNLYNQMYIALDTFPYNGTTTTCEALWMGVPVVSLCGNSHRSRVGKTLLSTVGLDSFVVYSYEEYIQKVIELCKDKDKVLELKKELRERLLASKLCDYNYFISKIETLYEKMISAFY